MSQSNAFVLWRESCERLHVARDAVPLFQANDRGQAATRRIGRGLGQPVHGPGARLNATRLTRSPAGEANRAPG